MQTVWRKESLDGVPAGAWSGLRASPGRTERQGALLSQWYAAAVELVILIGLQGAGKSSFYRQRFAGTHVHVSRDEFPRARNPARRQAEMIDAALAAGRSVVVDNTNARVADRAPLIEHGKQWGAEVIGYYFEPDLRLSVARNRGRSGSQRVPDVAIFATKKRLAPPSIQEGFDRLYSVKFGPNDEPILSTVQQ